MNIHAQLQHINDVSEMNHRNKTFLQMYILNKPCLQMYSLNEMFRGVQFE